MGNTLDKRAYRREHHQLFRHVIKHSHLKTSQTMVSLKTAEQNKAIQVLIRKRPLFEHEKKKNEFDVIECSPSAVAVHICKSQADMKPENSFVETRIISFPKASVYNETINNDQLYHSGIHSVIKSSIEEKQRATIFMYGQTGTGKSYTSEGIMKNLSEDVFQMLQCEKLKKLSLSVQCLELMNDKLFDLNNQHSELQLLQVKDEVLVSGAVSKVVNSTAELYDIWKSATNMRETHATAVNSSSSRSHFLFRILIHGMTEGKEISRINIIDLAGSERNADSLYHDKERQKESAWINSSLMALKDVIRTFSENERNGTEKRLPFRASKLTLLLKDSFSRKKNRSKTIIIGTVSPNSTDTEHSLNTLNHLSMLMGLESCEKENQPSVITTVKETLAAMEILRQKEEKKMTPVVKWSHDDVKCWLFELKKGKYKKYVEKFPSNIDGKQLSRFSSQRLAIICGDNEVGSEIRKCLQKYNDQVSKQKTKFTKERRDRLHGEQSSSQNSK